MSDTVLKPSSAAEDPSPTTGTGRHFLRRGPSRRWMAVFCSLLALAVFAAVVLTYAGIETVRGSRAGEAVSAVTDPTAPGFEAFLEPTPTLVVLHRDGASVRSMAVLGLNSGDQGGSVLLVSPDLRSSTDEGGLSFAALAGFAGGPEAVLGALQASLGFGITETALVDDARWAELVAPVAPVQIDNPTAVGPFPAGPLALTADQVGPYLAARNEGEDPRTALVRQRAFYRAWIDAVGASGRAAAVPGELESGIGRFVRGLAAGPHEVEPAPILQETVDGGVRYDLDREAVTAMIGDLIPFPTAGRPGGRVRVRLLDGAGEADHVQVAAPLIVPANAEIVVVGNADAFDYTETEVRYHNPIAKPAARELLAALGAGRLVEDPRQTDAFDVTIVLGSDV